MDKIHMLTGLGLLAITCTANAAQEERVGPFAALDLDGDGAVNFQEFMEGDLPLLATLDSDENGVLTLDEFLNGRVGFGRGNNAERPPREEDGDRRAERQEQMQDQAQERFAQMDLDGDEIVTAAEFKEATFQQMDSDSDGQLTAQEMRPPRGPGDRGPGRRGEGGNGPRGQNL